ncbi:MAG: hypothetical protein AAFY88_05240, partial [Acidobacteriota bacterium]
DGDLILEDGAGAVAMAFNGSEADATLGFDGGDGDLVLTRSAGTTTVSLSGNSAAITLGSNGSSGDVIVKDGTGSDTFVVNGFTGDVTNSLGGNGLAKAWCQVDGAGNLIAGFRCSSVQRIASGNYFVDFTALATDITSRPFLASCTSLVTNAVCTDVRATTSSDDLSRIVVTTDTSDDGAFTVVIF